MLEYMNHGFVFSVIMNEKARSMRRGRQRDSATLPCQTPLIQRRDPRISTRETVKRPLIRRGLMNYWSPPSMPIRPHPSPTHSALRIYIPFKSESFEFRLGFWARSLKRATQRWMFLRWRPINLRDSLLSAPLDLLNSLCHAWVNGKSFPKHFSYHKRKIHAIIPGRVSGVAGFSRWIITYRQMTVSFWTIKYMSAVLSSTIFLVNLRIV